MSDLKYWVWFSKAVGNHHLDANTLLESSTPEEIFKMNAAEMGKRGVTDGELLQSLCNKDLRPVEKEIAAAQRFGVKLSARGGEDYPKTLADIDDAPYVLYRRGTSDETGEEKLRIAVIGSRKASEYGLKVAYDLAFALAERGVVIVGGMATGIDAEAHKGAVDAGGKTIAVLGCGVNVVYPKENANLMVDIMKNGEVMSEFAFDTPPYKWNFPQRNRIISGLADGVVVVEAEEISGTSVTAKFTLEQGKELFAVPGNITSPNSVGTNRLIREGAIPVTCVDDILSAFPEFETVLPPKVTEEAKQEIIGTLVPVDDDEGPMPEQIILEAIRTEALSVDEISEKTGLSMSQVSSIMTIMELSGLADALPGHKYIKTSKIK